MSEQKVLFEEDYVDCLEKIIQRDYYPDLHAIRQRVCRGDIDDDTPVEPVVTSKKMECTDGGEVNLELSGVSLNQFVNNFTSEDNRSFEQVTKESMKQVQNQQLWINQSALHNVEPEQIGDGPSFQSSNRNVLGNAITGRNALMFPMESSLQAVVDTKKETKPENTRFNHTTLTIPVREITEDSHIDHAALGRFSGPGFVSTPLIDATPLMTWGRVASSPSVLDERTPFHVPDVPREERIVRQITSREIRKKEEAARSKQKKVMRLVSMLTPSTSLRTPMSTPKR
ncbi:MAG: hypothetical protein KVP17_001736 [Porospora cf. gigantea B]|uniref:uncharacterized protein n=1 Tax=Porospora cf. gigantea B TaxID=2853592 RepID=UPI003571C086|nr:MAG: hypothetical protein KVP17_001736 [Porospora cf. gigantea B]